MDMKFKKVLTELLSEGYISWDEKRAYILSQSILGHKIVDFYDNEIDEMYEKMVGFVLDNGYMIAISGINSYNEKTGKYIVGGSGSVVYEHQYWWEHDDEVRKENRINPYGIDTPEGFAEAKANAIFPNKKELSNFIKLMKYLDRVQFKGGFENMVTGEDSFNTEPKHIDVEKYKGQTVYRYRDVFTCTEADFKNDKHHDRVTLTFTNGKEGWDMERFLIFIYFSFNSMGKLSEKPDVSINYAGTPFSELKEYKTDIFKDIIKDILKQVK